MTLHFKENNTLWLRLRVMCVWIPINTKDVYLKHSLSPGKFNEKVIDLTWGYDISRHGILTIYLENSKLTNQPNKQTPEGLG